MDFDPDNHDEETEGRWPAALPVQHLWVLLSSTSRCLISWFSCSNLEIVLRTSSLTFFYKEDTEKKFGVDSWLSTNWAWLSGFGVQQPHAFLLLIKGLLMLTHLITFFRWPTFSLSFSLSPVDPVSGPEPVKNMNVNTRPMLEAFT